MRKINSGVNVKNKTLILGLGNELLGDDAAGVIAARQLRKRLGEKVKVIETSLAGLALLEILIGYDQVIIIDAIQTNKYPPGTIYELNDSDLDSVIAPSPHYAGIPEMLALAQQLQLEFPKKIKIFALEVADPYTIGKGLSKSVENAMESLINRVQDQVNNWLVPSYGE